MTISEQIAKETAELDPHGLKGKGDTSAKHLHVNEPYVHQEFPRVVYKVTEAAVNDKIEKTVESKIVKNAAELEAAEKAGFSKDAPDRE